MRLPSLLPLALLICCTAKAWADEARELRVATFNVAMGMAGQSDLAVALESGDHEGLRKLASIVRRVRPDVLLLNEFDYDPDVDAATLLNAHYLGETAFPFSFRGPVNTGVGSGLDLDGDGDAEGPGDAWGFGHFPGQYGMLLLSRFPIHQDRVKDFREFRWSALPGASRPLSPDGNAYHDDRTWQQLRLSSKSHWDVPIQVNDRTLHLLVSHPTPPVFDGPEDRNGRRNHDEIRFWAEYIRDFDEPFVIAGDMNSDPLDGDSRDGAISQLLESERINSQCTPRSLGGQEASRTQGGQNTTHEGDPAADTSDFNDRYTGNLRLDYVLPSADIEVIGCGVFWPGSDEPGHELIDFSDHRLVWADIRL